MVCNFGNDYKELRPIILCLPSFLILSAIPFFFSIHKLQGYSLSVFRLRAVRYVGRMYPVEIIIKEGFVFEMPSRINECDDCIFQRCSSSSEKA